MSVTRIWVFDPANNTDHEAGGLEAVRMREKEEATLIQLGLPRTVSYSVDQI